MKTSICVIIASALCLGPVKAEEGKSDQTATQVSSMAPIAQQELIAGDGVEEDGFGVAVAVSGDGKVVVVGATGRSLSRGAAYIFLEHDGRWSLQQELYASDGNENDAFGCSVALSADGHVLLIGAGGKNSNAGATYVFERDGDTWLQRQELQAADGAAGDYFGGYVGCRVGIGLSGDGDIALIAAPGKNSLQGAAYVFAASAARGDHWSQRQELRAPDGLASDEFALSVTLNGDGNTAFIGAIGRNSFAGAVYVFAEYGGNWVLQQELMAGDGVALDRFGYSISIAGNERLALIGAIGRNGLAGAAYLFNRDGGIWSQGQKLQATDPTTGDRFGCAVALIGQGDTALVGAPGRSSFAGAACVFIDRRGTWAQRQELQADPGNFGFATAVDGGGKVAVVGAPGTQNDIGAAYVMNILEQ